MTAKKDELLHCAVVIDVTCKKSEWMELFGEHITANQLVPNVTLEKATRKAAAAGLMAIGIPSMEVK